MKSIALALAATALLAPLHAQEAPSSPPAAVQDREAPPPPPRPPVPPRAPQPAQGAQGERETPPPSEKRPLPTRNVKVDITISDQSGDSQPVKKLVSLVVADGRSSGVRSSSQVPVRQTQAINYRDLPLNVDTTVTITPDAQVLVDLRFNYGSLTVVSGEPASFGQITENLSVLLAPGKPIVIARSADAASDRTVTVEVKAEILK